MKKRILLGLMGTIGSGKTTISNYLVKKGFFRVIMGDLVREKVRQEDIELTRESLQAAQKKYRKLYGEDFFMKEAIKILNKSGRKRLLIDGIRLPIDAKEAKKAGARLILIDASPKIRFERLKARGREDDPKTFLEFMKQERAEWRIFKFERTLKYVDFKIDNSNNLEKFYKNVNKLLEKNRKT